MSSTCFIEDDPSNALWRRGLAEALGTLFLVLAAAGAGAAHGASGQIPELHLIAAALSTALALVGLVIALGSVSGGHFNPLITALQWLRGERDATCTAVYCGCQMLGAVFGGIIVDLVSGAQTRMTELDAPTWSLVSSEFICSLALMLIVFGCIRSGRTITGPLAVGAWLIAAILATPSASYANPALTMGAVIARGSIALSPTTAISYVIAQIAGAAVALLPLSAIYPSKDRLRHSTERATGEQQDGASSRKHVMNAIR